MADKLKDVNANPDGAYTKNRNCPYCASESINAAKGNPVKAAKDRGAGNYTAWRTSGVLKQQAGVKSVFGTRKSFSQQYYSGSNLSGYNKVFDKMQNDDIMAIVSSYKKLDHIFVVQKKFDRIWAIESQMPHKIPVVSLFEQYAKNPQIGRGYFRTMKIGR